MGKLAASMFSVLACADEITRPPTAIATRGVRASPRPVNRERKPQPPIQYPLPFRARQAVQSKKISRAYNHNHNPLNTPNVTAKENLPESRRLILSQSHRQSIKTIQSTGPTTRGIRFCMRNNLHGGLIAAGCHNATLFCYSLSWVDKTHLQTRNDARKTKDIIIEVECPQASILIL